MSDDELASKMLSEIQRKQPSADTYGYTISIGMIRDALPQLRALLRPQVTEFQIEWAAKKAYDRVSEKSSWGIGWGDPEINRIWIDSLKFSLEKLGLYAPPPAPTPGEQFIAELNAELKAQGVAEVGGMHAATIAKVYEAMKEKEGAK